MNDEQKQSDGFGIAEVLVAVMLLMVVALSMLPVVIAGLRASGTNVSVATATQLVSEQMDLARNISPTCAAVQTFAAETGGLLWTDPRGVVLEIHREAPTTCPAPSSYPAAYRLNTWVTKVGETDKLAEAETRIFIKSAG